MRTTSRGHSIDLGDCLPYRSHSNSWDSLIAYSNHEGAGSLTEDEHPASSSATRTPLSYRKPVNAPVANDPTYQSAGPWLGEGDTNIWAHASSQRAPAARRSVDHPRTPPQTSSLPPTDRRLSLDSLAPLQAIWNQSGQTSFAQSSSSAYQHMPQNMQDVRPELEPPFARLSRQDLQASPYPQLSGHQLHAPALDEARRLAQYEGSWEDQQLLNGQQYHHGGTFSQQLLPEIQGSPLQDRLTGDAPSGYVENTFGQGPQLGSQFRLPPEIAATSARASLLDGLSQTDLRTALQHPQTARYIKQLELEALWAAKAQSQTKSLEERLSTARQVALGMQNLHRSPPPPPPRMGRPALPPPLDPATVQRYLAQTGLGTINRTPKTSPRTGKERSLMLGGKPKVEMEALTASLEALVVSLTPSSEEVTRQEAAFAQVSNILKSNFPYAKIHQFGSTANTLSICGNNDIGICLEIFEPDNEQGCRASVIEQVGKLMAEAQMNSIVTLPNARVPVVKFVVPDTATKVDVVVNNLLAISNTRLLRDYASIDPRLKKLIFIVKHWAKRRQVNDSYRGTLSSYCYVLMCIHFLQTREPPILPCLQSIQPPTHIRTVGHWKCDYYDKPMPGFGKENRETLGELVWKFFEFWAWAHDFNNSVVSVRTGRFLSKAQKDWTRRIGNERHLICIEDPFETSHDLGRTVDRQTSGILHKEFDRAALILRDEQEPLAELFDPYRAGKTE